MTCTVEKPANAKAAAAYTPPPSCWWEKTIADQKAGKHAGPGNILAKLKAGVDRASKAVSSAVNRDSKGTEKKGPPVDLSKAQRRTINGGEVWVIGKKIVATQQATVNPFCGQCSKTAARDFKTSVSGMVKRGYKMAM